MPDIDRHISTQANNTNYGTFQFWEKLGATRVVTARELSLREIRQIREHISDDLEIETFVHGAMCISYSGRCLLSNYFTGRDANRGACIRGKPLCGKLYGQWIAGATVFIFSAEISHRPICYR